MTRKIYQPLRGSRSLPSPMHLHKNQNQELDIAKLVRNEINNYFRHEVQREIKALMGTFYNNNPIIGGAAEILTKNLIYDIAHVEKKPLATQLLGRAIRDFLKQF